MTDGRRLIWKVEYWYTCVHDRLRGYDDLRIYLATPDGMAGRLLLNDTSAVMATSNQIWDIIGFCQKEFTK